MNKEKKLEKRFKFDIRAKFRTLMKSERHFITRYLRIRVMVIDFGE